MLNKENLIREIYWIFRNSIHNGHIQIKIVDGKAKAYLPNKIKYSSCYVCDTLHKVEKEIAELFGEEYHTCQKIVTPSESASQVSKADEHNKDLKFSKEGDTCICPKCNTINKFEGEVV